jgi:gamma-glutamylputrescine oxidase
MTDYIDTYYARTRAPGEDLACLDQPIDAEVCVIGGGLAGLTTALSLSEKGRSVALLEARRVGWGASGRNGGFVSGGKYSQSFAVLVKRRGHQHARQLHDLCMQAWHLVGDRIETYDMADIDRRDGLLLASLFDDDDALRRHRDQMQTLFDHEMTFIPGPELSAMTRSPRYHAGLVDKNCFHMHPLNYCLGIAKATRGLGGQIFEQSPATALSRVPGGFRVETAQGSVACREVVLAMGGYQTPLVPKLARAVIPIATYVMLTEPIEQTLLDDALASRYAIYDDKFALDYYRRVDADRILWGGRVSARLIDPANLADLMLADLTKAYPQLAGTAPAVAWSGAMSYAGHQMPQIGRSNDGVWYAQAFGGSGMVTTTLAGSLIAEAITGESDRYLQFKPFSIPWAGGPLGRFAAQLTYWAYQARDSLKTR